MRTPHRSGICVCGKPLPKHFDRRNGFVSCEQLAERDWAERAAAACTTVAEAEHAVFLHDIAVSPDPRD